MTDTLLPFLIFAAVASATPGPNNIMLMSTAAVSGMRATVPLILGVSLGFGLMVLIVGTGLAVPVSRSTLLQTAMRWAGVAWLLVLAWKIAHAPPLAPGPRAPARIGFWGAFAVQWVNPKAWIMALATAATYTAAGIAPIRQVPVLAALFVLIGLPTLTFWALIGAGAGRRLTTPGRQRVFNRIMGALLAVSVIPTLLD